MKKILLSFCILFAAANIFSTHVWAASSPVVQVVSYKEPLGLYFSLQGWGSGSIIDKQGHIITNNHVVDDGLGGISDNFAVCMTDDPSLPPRCHYTASVIDRDVEADIAVLRLDATDIFGKSVDFSALSLLTMDMDYLPKSGDTVIARGYPWVGANTITETQGIISGTAQYNGNTYIKTDTLIAGGNSGGPLIYNDTLVGVNTFLIGGGYDPSLGYSLLISEVQNFIRGALLRGQKLQTNNVEFPKFLQKIETFSSQKKITDSLISVNLGEQYTILSYIPATSFSAALSDADTTSVSSLSFYHIRTPRMDDVKQLQKYLSYEFGVPDGVFRPVTIGGKNFYELIYDQNPENDKTKNEYIYFMIVDDTHLLFLHLETPVPTKNTLDNIQKSVKDFLSNITFPAQFVFPKPQDITLSSADIRIRLLPESSVSYEMQQYRGILSQTILNQQDFVSVRNYLGSFWSSAETSVFRNSFETEDNSVDMWLKNVIESMYLNPVSKKKVTYQGHEGFLICTESMLVDESNKNQDIIRCETVLLVGEEREYIVSTQMILPKKQLKNIDTLMLEYLKNTLQLPVIGETLFVTQKDLKSLFYSDVSQQTLTFQELLRNLLAYGVLQHRPQFEGDAPLRWREYFNLYIWAVYHKRMKDIIDPNTPGSPTFEKALSILPVIMDDYAENDTWQLEAINNLIRLLIAGGSLPKYDFDTIYDFSESSYRDESDYRDAWNTILAFESIYFPDYQPLVSAEYTSEKSITYNPFTGLDIGYKNDKSRSDFFRNNVKNKEKIDMVLRCESNASLYFSTECQNMRKDAIITSLTYSVLTKGKAIESILGYINPSLWKEEGIKTE